MAEFCYAGKRSENLADAIREVESQVEQGINAGVDLYEVVEMIAGARMMLDSDLLDDAERLVDKARSIAGMKIMQYDRVKYFIQQGKRQIETLARLGELTEEAEKVVEKAEHEMQRGNYQIAMGYAMQCIEHTKDQMEKRRQGNIEAP